MKLEFITKKTIPCIFLPTIGVWTIALISQSSAYRQKIILSAACGSHSCQLLTKRLPIFHQDCIASRRRLHSFGATKEILLGLGLEVKQVYHFENATRVIQVVADGFIELNGIEFSPGLETLYVTDTGSQQCNGLPNQPSTINAFDIVNNSRLQNRRIFAWANRRWSSCLEFAWDSLRQSSYRGPEQQSRICSG